MERRQEGDPAADQGEQQAGDADRHEARDADPAEGVGDHAAHGEAQRHDRRGPELDVGARLLVGDAADIAQPRPDPQRNAADEGELLDREQRLDAPVEAVGQDRAGDAELLGERAPLSEWAPGGVARSARR